MPGSFGIVGFGIAGERRASGEGDFAEALVLHGVVEDGGDAPTFERQFFDRAEGELGFVVVADGIVPPEAERTAAAEAAGAGEAFGGEAAFRHTIAGVEDEDVRAFEARREGFGISGRAPLPVLHSVIAVFRGDGDEGMDVRVAGAEFFVHDAEERGLPGAVAALDVVKEDGEVADAKLVERFEFREHGGAVGGSGAARSASTSHCGSGRDGGIRVGRSPARDAAAEVQVEAGRDGKDEADAVFLRSGDEARKVGKLGLRVRLAPFFAMIRVVFRGVDIGIEARAPAKRNHVEAGVLRPRRAVKALDDAAQRNRGGLPPAAQQEKSRKECQKNFHASQFT